MKLNEVASYSEDKLNAGDVNKDNYVGVDNLLPNKQGKTEALFIPTEGRLIHYRREDVLIGNIRPYLKKIWFSSNDGGTNGDVLVIRVKQQNLVIPKYLFYVLASDDFFNYAMQHAKGAKMPRGDKAAIMQYKFALPSLEKQERIVTILDCFDTLCNDLTSGISAEIEARHKQYEYYRDKLLNF